MTASGAGPLPLAGRVAAVSGGGRGRGRSFGRIILVASTGGGLLRRASAVEWGTVSLPSGSSLSAAGLADLVAESGRGEPREFGVSVDAFTDLCRSGRLG